MKTNFNQNKLSTLIIILAHYCSHSIFISLSVCFSFLFFPFLFFLLIYDTLALFSFETHSPTLGRVGLLGPLVGPLCWELGLVGRLVLEHSEELLLPSLSLSFSFSFSLSLSCTGWNEVTSVVLEGFCNFYINDSWLLYLIK